MYFFYILKRYFINFVLILFSLSFFFVLIDFIANYSRLPDSSNLQVLYIYYEILYSIDMFYPLALVFSYLLTVYYMVKFNEIVSFYSLGFSPKKLLMPFMFLALCVFTLFMFLDSGKFAYVKEYANSILNKNKYSSNNLFLKYKDKIIYIKKIRPILKEVENVKVFILDKNSIKKIIVAKKAKFKNDVWIAKKAEITLINGDKITKEVKDIKLLKGFKPKIISNLKKLNSISLYDAYIAINLFNDVNINTLLSIVFYKIFTALSLIFIIFALMFKIPLHSRISNVSLFLVKSSFFTILIWGSDLMIYKFAKQGVVSPYLLALPFFVILVYGIYLFYKEK